MCAKCMYERLKKFVNKDACSKYYSVSVFLKVDTYRYYKIILYLETGTFGGKKSATLKDSKDKEIY